MEINTIDWKSIRMELAAKRTELFDRFVKNPENIHLAIEIKLLADQMLECSEHMADLRPSIH